MVSLITAQQYFQANAKAIDTNTAVSQAIINLHS
jgi:flagellar hook protein FlgE